ncbi:hypothetical protein QVD17_20467 [Tagetes erecta]|uniref:Uncharacterized protein n=1 Tax=Tagetes erecta TaxID=13708 RepID=A0AAD8KLJ7_TARER|nr:hypothetical protein QVD17_20467 [Tagetes erecta]
MVTRKRKKSERIAIKHFTKWKNDESTPILIDNEEEDSRDKNEDLVLEKTQSVTKKRKNTTEDQLITYKRRKQNKEKAQKVVSNDTSYPYFPYTVLAILYANECDKRKRTTELEEDENVELEKFTYKMFTKIEEELVLELFEDKTKGSEKVGKKKKKRKDTTGKGTTGKKSKSVKVKIKRHKKKDHKSNIEAEEVIENTGVL